MHQNGGLIWDELKRMKADGVVGKLGASVQSPCELAAARTEADIEHVQLPYNLLDHRWDTIAADVGSSMTIHVRSAYLQGLLVVEDPSIWPTIAGVDPAQVLADMDRLVERFGRESRRDLCLAFVRGAVWVDGVVVGAETLDQLAENARLFANPPLDAEQRDEVRRVFPHMPERLLNPALWD